LVQKQQKTYFIDQEEEITFNKKMDGEEGNQHLTMFLQVKKFQEDGEIG
jgi:hypothetical protein